MPPFFAPLLEPLGAIWLLMSLFFLRFLWKKQWRSAWGVGAPTVLIFLLGSTPLADLLVERAERPYASESPVNFSSADVVIALGGGDEVSKHDPLGFSVGETADRNLAALQMVRLGKAKMLVLGGSYGFPDRPSVPVMTVIQEWIVAWQLSSVTVTNLGICANTHDEALQTKKMQAALSWKKIILVTSALHMKRSEAVFRKLGMDVVPVACDFQVYGVLLSPGNGFSPFPKQRRFKFLSLYLHEVIGWWVYQWRGWV
jgi:uncharacterized SAM-binding protein YcdF (DUF218 family)